MKVIGSMTPEVSIRPIMGRPRMPAAVFGPGSTLPIAAPSGTTATVPSRRTHARVTQSRGGATPPTSRPVARISTVCTTIWQTSVTARPTR